MPAQALELQLSLAVGGKLGDLSQAGKHLTEAIETYHGPNLLALSALLRSFLSISPANPTSQSMVTIKESSRAGGMEGAIIAQSTKFSSRSMTYQPLHQNTPSTLRTPQASQTRQMHHPKESTLHSTSSSHLFRFPHALTSSSSTPNSFLPPLRLDCKQYPFQDPISYHMLTCAICNSNHCTETSTNYAKFGNPLNTPPFACPRN
jgi:hypothetical protein